MLIQCRDCGLEKPFAEMAKDRSKPNGTKNRCLECQKEKDAAYRRSKGIQEVISKSFYLEISQQHGIEGRRILGRLCDKGHKWNGLEYSLRMVNRHGETDQCIECKREYARERNNTPEAKALMAQWVGENRDSYRLRTWLKNPRISPSVAELVEKEHAQWVKQNRYRLDPEYRARMSRLQKIRYHNTIDYQLNRVKVWRHANPHKVQEYSNTRVARCAKASDGTLTQEAVGKLFNEAKKCPYCNCSYERKGSKRKTLDHLTPISKGGWHSLSNVAVCCHGCNLRKRDKLFDEWLSTLADEDRARTEKLFKRVTGAGVEQGVLALFSGL